tara:strand:+ start:1461 stop:1589 length:129 start_codon:yes stop_codon:yes gene_type:complete
MKQKNQIILMIVLTLLMWGFMAINNGWFKDPPTEQKIEINLD